MNTTDTTFEDRLLDQLKREVVLTAAEDRLPAPRRRFLTPARVGLGLATAAAATVAAVVLPSSTAPAAYAVEGNADGSITVDIRRPLTQDDLEQLAEEAEAAGIRTIVNPPDDLDCRDEDGNVVRPGWDDGKLVDVYPKVPKMVDLDGKPLAGPDGKPLAEHLEVVDVEFVVPKTHTFLVDTSAAGLRAFGVGICQ